MIRAFGYHVVPAQTHIAQLLLPYTVPNIQDIKRGGGGFGSTNNQSVFWTTAIKLNKPLLQIKIKDRIFHGRLDTGADISVISSQYWPPDWLLTEAGISRPRISARSLRCYDPDRQLGQIQPYVLPAPLNIWGQALLTQWGMKITLPPFQ